MEATCPEPIHPETPLRAPDEVMRLERLGSFFPTRLSFMRVLIRRLAAARARVERTVWAVDAEGYGRAVYTVPVGGRDYSLVAFSTRLAAEDRTDRVIAQAWDASFVLFDGRPTTADLDRLQSNAPHQEAGRFTPAELVLSRANKSVRLFEHVVSALAAGRQPDAAELARVGYLMRTTAVYGNGKFGIADRGAFSGREGLGGSFAAEMLTVWLIRGFTLDLAEHCARARSSDAVPLAPEHRTALGVGNSTGLGMAPFLVNHPVLLNNWMFARETALARVRALPHCEHDMDALMERASRHLAGWNVDDARQTARIELLRREWAGLRETLDWTADHPFDAAIRATASLSSECQELVVALVLEPHGALIDGLADCMTAPREPRLDPGMSVAALRALVTRDWAWATRIDFDDPRETHRFWYVSEEKLEPRLGDRHAEPGAERETPLDIARQVQALAGDLHASDETSVARFLMRHPQHRAAARRVQTLAHCPYGEIRDNLIADTTLPIDMLRAKLSFFGASRFDPRSDRWTRITLYGGAPGFDDVARGTDCDDWWLPAPAAA